ncbi:MAG TPA: SDR family oxidoreductase [Vicinamibacterales bacterium]|nr:SDR family oxidoreductase [Vicinamibacterales bacterium]
MSSRVAVITGASSGIGLACATRLAADGVAVVLGARRADRLRAAVERIAAAGGRASFLRCDVARDADVAALASHAVETFGALDIMVCNAGFGYYGTVEQTPPDVMQRMMDVNFMGTYFGARAALPIFRRQGHGHLIFVSSIVGQRGIPLMSGYSATKAAQAVFAESLRSEFVGSAIHVSCVFPVSTDTEFRDAMTRDYGHSVSGLGPTQSVDDVARAIAACIAKPKPEVYPNRTARVLVALNAIAPGFTDRFVKRFGRRREVVPAAPGDRPA